VLEADGGALDQSTKDFDRAAPAESFRSRRRKIACDRDIERGYSINVKQVVLAFAVEFWIITLIIVGTFLLIADGGQLSSEAMAAQLRQRG
jgi:hypothetical protein